MSHYRRNYIEGGTFFFTVKLADPKSRLLVEHINLLREVYTSVQKRYPFETVAICVMPNHLHAVWTLPDGDSDYRGSPCFNGFYPLRRTVCLPHPGTA